MAARQYTEEEHKALSEKLGSLFGVPKEKLFLWELHRFEGVPFNKLIPPQNVEGLREWETREDDIFISTYPKSGTHWMYEIALLILADGHSEKIDRSQMMSSTLEMLQPPDMKKPTYEIVDTWKSPRVMLVHVPWQFLPKQVTEQKKGKIIYVMRNLKDVITSQHRFALANVEKAKDEEVWEYNLNTHLTGDVLYGSWFDHVGKHWEHRNQGNVFFTTYEQMKKDFRSVVKPLSKFLGHELDEDALNRVVEKSTVKAMKKSYDDIAKNVPGGAIKVKALGSNSFVQKGVAGSWKEFFTAADNELFEQVHKEKMASFEMDVVFE